MKKTHKVVVAVAAGVAVAATVAGAAIASKSDDSNHGRFAGPIHRIVVDAGASDVRITAGGRSDVDVTRKTTWLFMTLIIAAGALRPTPEERSPDRLDAELDMRATQELASGPILVRGTAR